MSAKTQQPVALEETTVVSIARDGNEIGEWSLDEVRVLYTKGQLFSSDHFWCAGMTEWLYLRDLLKPVKFSMTVNGKTVSANRVTRSEPITAAEEAVARLGKLPAGWSLAGFLTRCSARMIDYFILTAAIASIAYGASSALVSANPAKGPAVLCAFVFGYFVSLNVLFFVWDWAWLSLAGASPGKLVYGLRVIIAAPGAKRITEVMAGARTFSLLLGLWLLFGYPYLTVVLAMRCDKFFLQYGVTQWDQSAGAAVIGKELGLIRLVLAAILTIVSFFGILVAAGVTAGCVQSLR